MELTKLEKELLEDITNNEFYENGYESQVWVDSLLEECRQDVKVARGTLGSLVKKDIVVVYDGVGDGNKSDNVVEFSENGIQIMEQLKQQKEI